MSNHNWYLETTWSSIIVGIDNLQQFCVSSVTHKLIYQCNGFRIWQIQSFHDWWRVWVKNHLQVNQTLLLLLQRQWHKLLPHYCWRWRRSYEKIINPHFPSWQLKVSTWDVICHQNSSACHIRRVWLTLDVIEIGHSWLSAVPNKLDENLISSVIVFFLLFYWYCYVFFNKINCETMKHAILLSAYYLAWCICGSHFSVSISPKQSVPPNSCFVHIYNII